MMLPFAFLLLGSWISSWNGIPAFIPPRLARPPFLRSLYAFRNHSNGNDQQNFCFAVRQVPGDGSCLFHSLSAWISFIASNEHVDFDTRVYHLSNKLRQLAVDVLQQQNCTLHLEDGEKMSSEQMLQSASEYYGMSPHEYCETMRCSKTWGGGPEIVALSHHFQCPIFVYELSTEGYFPFKKFCVKMYARYGFPVFRNKPPIHLLNADGRFVDWTNKHSPQYFIINWIVDFPTYIQGFRRASVITFLRSFLVRKLEKFFRPSIKSISFVATIPGLVWIFCAVQKL